MLVSLPLRAQLSANTCCFALLVPALLQLTRLSSLQPDELEQCTAEHQRRIGWRQSRSQSGSERDSVCKRRRTRGFCWRQSRSQSESQGGSSVYTRQQQATREHKRSRRVSISAWAPARFPDLRKDCENCGADARAKAAVHAVDVAAAKDRLAQARLRLLRKTGSHKRGFCSSVTLTEEQRRCNLSLLAPLFVEQQVLKL